MSCTAMVPNLVGMIISTHWSIISHFSILPSFRSWGCIILFLYQLILSYVWIYIYILSFVIELFSQQHVLETHSCCSMHQNFILFTVYGHTTFYLSIHQLTGIWVVYTFCFLLIIFLQSFMYRCRILFLLNIYHTCRCNDKLYSFF